jgi:hypothetical protein
MCLQSLPSTNVIDYIRDLWVYFYYVLWSYHEEYIRELPDEGVVREKKDIQ